MTEVAQQQLTNCSRFIDYIVRNGSLDFCQDGRFEIGYSHTTFRLLSLLQVCTVGGYSV